ncbi:uncharacterized protein LOC134207336 [Armigeres subalbatus]|uniref:uncharacterized protein LOC134207336 n=1 Tax=Armigeres subalbatus TaxID=124917 RepID=UPI002ECFD617
MNVNLKLINSAVKDRLVSVVEINETIPKNSFGFRNNCSAPTCVNFVVNEITEAKKRNLECLVIFIDVSKASDSVKTDMLLNMAKQNIPEKLLSWIYTYLKERTLILKTKQGEINPGKPRFATRMPAVTCTFQSLYSKPT